MSLLWIVAVNPDASDVEHVPVSELGDPAYRRAWGKPEHPAMASLMDRIRGDGGYDPQRHGMLHVKVKPDGSMQNVTLPREHHVQGFGENSGHALAFALGLLGHTHVPATVTREKPPKPEKDPTRGRVFYHGTCTDEDLQEITPATQHGKGVIHQNGVSDASYAYVTQNPKEAWRWAELAWSAKSHGKPRVFKVRSRGPVEKDPVYTEDGKTLRGTDEGAVRSKHGFDVIHEVPMPQHLRHVYGDD